MKDFKQTPLGEWIAANEVGNQEASLLSNFPTFNVEIKDGVMCISPSEAGVALFTYIKLSGQDKKEIEETIGLKDKEIEDLTADNSKLRDLCETMLEYFDEKQDVESKVVKDRLLKIIYPITAFNTDGEQVKFIGEEY